MTIHLGLVEGCGGADRLCLWVYFVGLVLCSSRAGWVLVRTGVLALGFDWLHLALLKNCFCLDCAGLAVTDVSSEGLFLCVLLLSTSVASLCVCDLALWQAFIGPLLPSIDIWVLVFKC